MPEFLFSCSAAGAPDGARQDRRVRNTKAALRKSLLELMQTRSVHAISVRELCDRAGVSQGAFYAHFADPHALLFEMEKELRDAVVGVLDACERSGRAFETYAVAMELLQSVEKHAELYAVLAGRNGDGTFLDEMVREGVGRIARLRAGGESSLREEMAAYLDTFLAAGSVAVIRRWILSEGRTSAWEVAHMLHNLVEDGLRRYAGHAPWKESALG